MIKYSKGRFYKNGKRISKSQGLKSKPARLAYAKAAYKFDREYYYKYYPKKKKSKPKRKRRDLEEIPEGFFVGGIEEEFDTPETVEYETDLDDFVDYFESEFVDIDMDSADGESDPGEQA